jgi:iduronate 2-sulfatase
VETPGKLDGCSLLPQLTDPDSPTIKPAYGFWTGGQRTVRTDRWRLIAHPAKGESALQVELFDYETDPDETKNHAEVHPAVIAELSALLGKFPDPTKAGATKLPKN